MKLGKKPSTRDARDLELGTFLAKPPAAPATDTANTEAFTAWGLLGNDTVGDCVFAGGCHETMLWTKEGGKPASFTAKTALADYGAVTGYTPSDPSTDQGTDVREALKYRQKTGLVDSKGARHKLHAYLAVKPGDKASIRTAVHLMDAVGIGFEVPAYAMDQFDAGKPWKVQTANAGIEGGHYVPLIGYDATYLYAVSWGNVQRMTWGFFAKYVDEAWALLSVEFEHSGKSPDGLNTAALDAALKALK